VALNNYFATQCIGSGVEIINVNLLTGGTSNAFLGSDGICWYVTTNPTVSAATITPLLEFGIYSGTGCSDCATQGCVNWKVGDTGDAAKISFDPCCGETLTSPYDMVSGEIIELCSRTEPIALTGNVINFNLGICSSC
jgi:hypothetical protein